MIKNTTKREIIAITLKYRDAAHNVWYLRYNAPK